MAAHQVGEAVDVRICYWYTDSISMKNDNNTEVLEAVHELATHMDERFNEVKNDITQIRSDMGKLRTDMIDHVDRTVTKAKGEIIQTIRTDRERQKLFNVKILTMLERGKIAKPEEAEALRQLVA